MSWLRSDRLATVGLPGGGINLASCANSPHFHITLKPDLEEEGAYKLHGEIIIQRIFAENETFVQLPTTIANVPSANYSATGLVVTDDNGIVPYTSFIVEQGFSGLPHRHWKTQRATSGPVSVRFTAHPRQVNRDSLTSPHFDLRNGTNGLTGSLWGVLPVHDPTAEDEYDFTVSWDLDPDQSAAFTWADGVGSFSHRFSGRITDLLFTFFIVGDVHAYPSIPTRKGGKYGMYWLAEPPFNITETAIFIENLLADETSFWEENSDLPYRVFVRVNEETQKASMAKGSGGTALQRSFMFGYNEEYGINELTLKTLLAHEMTHNWTPWITGSQAEASRFAEGAAEYWSLRLMWRNGYITSHQFLSEMNHRLYMYYTNPTRNLSDEAAMEVAWLQREAQRIPYGRGLIHNANIDADLRAQSNGMQGLDLIARAYVKMCPSNIACGAEQWFPLLEDALGKKALEEWHQTTTGKPLIEPREGSLGPCFDVYKNSTEPVIWQWKPKKDVDLSSKDCLV
ncbi:hypothetical protein ABOM_003343 [Aspergillus bombycis]|uniref:Peptidase M61 catalytic domain-containing protein n=1 Tax=Aspergillus bombycis TaxID=109264 RepID=A0A1F8A7X3_9EURO|nr:hypothetical protein ABOM_003343 [Aspergillus bombycis]OGM47806.1 hypothetical protein ABOM_003343 [Aspergillus bombycis]